MISRNGEFKKEKIAWTLRVLLCLMVVGLVGLVSSVGYAVDRTWDGSASSDWADDANWDTVTPAAGGADKAIIPSSASYTYAPIFNEAALTLDALEIQAGGTLTIQTAAGDLTTDGGVVSSIAGTLVMDSAGDRLVFGTALTVSIASTATITLTAGTIAFDVATTIANGATITQASGSTIEVGAALTVNGDITMAGVVTFDAASTLTVLGGKTLTLGSSGNTVTFSAAVSLADDACILIFAGPVVTSIVSALTDAGTSATIRFRNNITVSNGATTDIALGSDVIFDGDSTINFGAAGTGTVQLTDVTVNDSDGSSAITLALTGIGTLDIDGNLTVGGSTSGTNYGQIVTTVSTADVTLAGNLVAYDTTTIDGQVTFDGGSSQTITIASGETVTLGGTGTEPVILTQSVALSATSAGTIDFDGELQIALDQTFTDASGSTTAIIFGNGAQSGVNTAAATPIDLDGNVTFDGAGTLVVGDVVGGGDEMNFDGNVTISAALDLNTGTAATLDINGDLTIASGGTLTDSDALTTITIAGDFDASSGTITTLDSPVTFDGGSVQDFKVGTNKFDGAITINSANANVTLSSGTLNADSNFTITDGAFTLGAGTAATFAGNFTNNDTLATAFTASSASFITFDGALNLDSLNGIIFDCPVKIDNDVTVVDADVTFNEDVSISSTKTFAVALTDNDGDCVITVAAGKTIDLAATDSALTLTGAPSPTYKRVVLKSGTAGSPFYIDATECEDALTEITLTHVALVDVTIQTDDTTDYAKDVVTCTATAPYTIDAGGNSGWVQDTSSNPLDNLECVSPRADQTNAKDDTSYSIARQYYNVSWTDAGANITYDIYVDADGDLRTSSALDDAIASSQTAASYSWDTTYVTCRDYYIYLVPTNDTDYVIVSNNPVRIARAYFTTGNQPLGDDDVATARFTVTWTDNNEILGPGGTVDLRYSTVSTHTDIDTILGLSQVVPTADSGATLPVDEDDTDNQIVWDTSSIAAGTYYVYVIYQGSWSYDVSGSIEIKSTSIEITIPTIDLEDRDAGFEWYTIEWIDEDDVNNAEIRLYYSTQNNLAGSDMSGSALTASQVTAVESNIGTDPTTKAVLINSSTMNEDDDGDDDRYLWNLSSVDPGDYYIYALLDSDGDDNADSGYQSSGTVQVQHQDAFVWFYDYSGSSYTNGTTEVISTGTMSAPLAATNDALYIGGYNTFTTISVVMGVANDAASVMTAKYWNGSAWTAVAGFNDGTDAAGDTLKSDGDVTWTAPSDWVQNSVNGVKRYWIQITVSLDLDAGTTIDTITLDAESGSITVTSPANDVVATDSVVIRWVDQWNSHSETGTVDLYYSATSGLTTSNITTSGTAIAYNLAEAGLSGGSYTWSTSGITAGTYYIYAVLDEDNNGTDDVLDEAPGTVTVTSDFAVTLTNSTSEPAVGETYTVTINLNTGSSTLDIKSAAIYLDFNTTYLNVASETDTFTYLRTVANFPTTYWTVTEFQNVGDNTAGTAAFVVGSATAGAASSTATNFASIDFVVQQTGNLSVEISTAPGRETSFIDENGKKHYPTVAKPVSGVALGTISGQIDLEGRTNEAEEITFELRRPGSLGNTSTWTPGTLDEDGTTEGVQVTTETDGSFYLTNIPTGYWYLTAKAPNYLRRQNVDANNNTVTLAITPGVNTTATFQQLLGGECYDDVDNLEDNDIDATDLAVFAGDFGGTEEGSDIDGSGTVDVDDFTMLATNYGKDADDDIAGPYGSAYPGVNNNNTAPSVEVSEATLELVGVPEQPKMGKSFKVQVVLKNVENIRGYGFNLEYDPTQMQVVAKRGDFLAKNSSNGMPLFINKTIDTEDGKKLALAEALMGSDIAGASGEGTVATLIIKPLEAGPLAITLIDGRLMPISGKSKVITEIMHPVVEVIKGPAASVLRQNYPNPFNPETWIPYSLKNDAKVEIRIYNAAGQLVYKLHQGFREADHYVTKDKAAYWNGRNEYGERAASGIYFYQIRAGNFAATRKMVILK